MNVRHSGNFSKFEICLYIYIYIYIYEKKYVFKNGWILHEEYQIMFHKMRFLLFIIMIFFNEIRLLQM